MIEYRLSWETPTNVWLIGDIEALYGENCWPTYNWATLGEWHRTEVVFTGNDRMDQYDTLKEWAETREQPIRNVKLERRVMPDPDKGWEEVAA